MSNIKKSEFLTPGCTLGTIDNYHIRRSIVNAITSNLGNFNGTLLDVGCGQMPYKSLIMSDSNIEKYLGLDFEVNHIHDNQPDICWEDGHIPLDDNSVDSVLCTEVLEHCPDPDVVLAEVARVLRPGGFILFTVPFLWPLHEVPYDHYRYTPFALRRHLSKAGFDKIEVHAMGGWDASLAQMLGLWARRRPMSGVKRVAFSVLMYPFYRWLLYSEEPKSVKFEEGPMISGIWGTAVTSNATAKDKLHA